MEQDVLQKVDDFFSKYISHSFEKKTILIRAGEEPRGIFYLKKGHVRQYIITQNGDEMTLNIFKPHTFFPISWALDTYQTNYYFEAITPIEVVEAPKNDVLLFIKKEPLILFDLLHRVFVGLDGMFSRLEYLMSGTARQKLITILIISAKRFGEQQKGDIVISLQLTHQDLASLSGISRETVSREMMRLKEQNIIDYTNFSTTLHSIEALEKELET